MERNTKFWAVLAIWLSYTVVFGLGRDISSLPTQINTVKQNPPQSLTLTSTEVDKANYQQFLLKLRTQLANGGTVSHGIPVLRATASSTDKYLLVNIKSSNGKEISFGLSVINAYVLAYKVGDNSYFFTDKEYKDTMKYLFTNTKQTPLAAFSGNYDDFSKQGAPRSQTNIGIGALNEQIETLFYNTLPTKISKPLVCAIQMIAEAARFKYIEKKITDQDYYGSFTPGTDITSRENSWDPLSEGIQYADKDGYLQKVNKNGKLERTTVILADKTVQKVNQIDTEMGLLKYAKPVK